MDLKRLKSVVDKGTHFEVNHEDHGAFPIKKTALNKEMLRRVQAMCKGGAVQKLSGEGGNPVDQVVQPRAANALPGVDYSGYGGTPSPGFGVQGALESAGKALGIGAPSPDEARMAASAAPAPVAVAPSDPATNFAMGASSPVVPTEPKPDAAPSVDQAALNAQLAANAKAGEAPPAVQQMAAAQAHVNMPSAAGIMGAIGQQQNAVLAGGKAAADEEQAAQVVREAHMKQQETVDNAFKATMAAQDAAYERQKQAVDSAEVNPNHYWHSMGTGGKIASTIGILLSGLGAGMSGGQNQALQVIDKNIDRDIEAQKIDLGKKESQLSQNLQRTGDLRTAYMMTKAQALNNLQLQLQSNAAKFGGPKVQAQTALAIGQLEQQKQALKYQVGMQVAATAGQAEQQAAYGRAAAGIATPADEAMLPEPMRKMMVAMEDGVHRGLAHSDESAKNYKDAQEAYQPVRKIVSHLKAAAKELTLGTLRPDRRKYLSAEVENLQLQLPAALAGLKRLNENEYNAAVKMAPNPADIYKPGAVGAYDALANMLDDKWRATANTHLMRPALTALPTNEG